MILLVFSCWWWDEDSSPWLTNAKEFVLLSEFCNRTEAFFKRFRPFHRQPSPSAVTQLQLFKDRRRPHTAISYIFLAVTTWSVLPSINRKEEFMRVQDNDFSGNYFILRPRLECERLSCRCLSMQQRELAFWSIIVQLKMYFRCGCDLQQSER